MIQADRFLANGRRRALVWAAAFSALAWQAKYIGVALPACVGLLLLSHTSPTAGGASLAGKMRSVTVYSLIVALPMGLWLLRNLGTMGEFTMHPPPGSYPASMMLWDVFHVLRSWAQTNTAAILAPLVCILAVAWRRRLHVADWRPCWLFGGFALTYLVLFIMALLFLVGINMTHGVAERFLVPLYIPLLTVGLFMLDRVLDHERERRLLGSIGSLPIVAALMPGRKASVMFAITAIFLSLGVASQTVSYVFAIQPLAFNEPHWRDSETLRYVRENLTAEKIYSSAPQPLSLHAGKDRKYAPYPRLPYIRAKLRPPYILDGAYVVWHYIPSGQRRDYGETYLRQLPGLEPVAELADGVVFRAAWPPGLR